MNWILGEWREGKVRPIPGNAPHARPVSRGIFSLWSICDDPYPATRFPQQLVPGARYAFLRHGGIYLVRWGFNNQNQNLGRDHTASRWSGTPG